MLWFYFLMSEDWSMRRLEYNFSGVSMDWSLILNA